MLSMRPFLAILATGVLSGCVTSQDYQTIQVAFQDNPQMQAVGVAECVKNNRSSASDIPLLRALMRLPPNADPVRVGCQRIAAAVGSGRLTYEDYSAVSFGRMTPNIIRVLKG